MANPRKSKQHTQRVQERQANRRKRLQKRSARPQSRVSAPVGVFGHNSLISAFAQAFAAPKGKFQASHYRLEERGVEA